MEFMSPACLFQSVDSGAQQMVPGFTLISRRDLLEMPVKMVTQLQGDGHSQLKAVIKFLQKKSFILNCYQPAMYLECITETPPPQKNILDKELF